MSINDSCLSVVRKTAKPDSVVFLYIYIFFLRGWDGAVFRVLRALYLSYPARGGQPRREMGL